MGPAVPEATAEVVRAQVTAQPWAFVGPVSALEQSAALVTLVEGSTFCLADRTGDLWRPNDGLFVLDARLLSQFVLLLDGHPILPLTVAADSPYSASFVGRSRPVAGLADSDLLVLRRRYVGAGMREDIEVRNAGRAQVSVRLELLVGADFADIFDVKQERADTATPVVPTVLDGTLRFDQAGERSRHVLVTFAGSPELRADRVVWQVDLEPRASWQTCVSVTCGIDSTEIPPRYRCGEPIERAVPAQRLQAFLAETSQIVTQRSALRHTLARSVADLGSLRLFDPEHPEFPAVAAGAPWYMTLFGRDSLITGWMALPLDPRLAFGALETLARLQGRRINPATEEEPGRILHEVRTAPTGHGPLGGAEVYYGTIDATPLFVMLLGEVHRWGLYPERVRALLPAADRAITWMEQYGDLDGDGYLEYARQSAHGLVNQGWKDSFDGVAFADGTMPEPPIALAEVQGYAYAAYLAQAELADSFGEPSVARRARERARSIRAAFNRDFWLPEQGYYALALDGAKAPVDALASNMGHCLWTGIVDEARAGLVADHLLSPALFGGWGVRTLATTMAAYNPLSYHNGSVWPHDNAIIVAGLIRYGFTDHARRIALAMLDAAERLDGRLPELFAGLDRAEVTVPVSYPSSCSPQAWAAAAPLLMLRSMLRLDPDLSSGRLHLAPALPPETGPLSIRRMRLGDARVDIDIDAAGNASVLGLPAEVTLVRTPIRDR